jgi:hypothetical protein
MKAFMSDKFAQTMLLDRYEEHTDAWFQHGEPYVSRAVIADDYFRKMCADEALQEAGMLMELTESSHGPDRELVSLPYLCAIDSRKPLRKILADALREFIES